MTQLSPSVSHEMNKNIRMGRLLLICTGIKVINDNISNEISGTVVNGIDILICKKKLFLIKIINFTSKPDDDKQGFGGQNWTFIQGPRA